jgi:hypothetical protein
MSSWNPPPEGSGGWPGDPGQGYLPPPGPGVPGQQWYGVPDIGGYQPPGRRRGILRRLGIVGAVLIVAIIVASVLVYEHENHSWKLTAPGTAAGLQRDTNPLDTLGLSDGATGARSAITKIPGYGSIKSSVSAAYQTGSGPLVWFIGFNGSFDKQIVLESYQGARIRTVNAGPHGGAAECASSASATFCQWSTSSTVGDLIIRTSVLGGPVSTASADSLMIKMRNSVEHPA